MKKEEIIELKSKYESACYAMVAALLKEWDFSSHYCFWVGDKVGGTYIIGDTLSLGMDEIIYCVENNVSQETCTEWMDYCLMCNEFNFDVLSLKSYHNNAPRVPQETFDKLYKMKQDLDDAIKEEKQKQKAVKKPLSN